jgi:hypothetical protein
MSSFQEIEDVRDLRKHSEELMQKIAIQAPYRKNKAVGYPSGRSTLPINFELKSGADVLWWSNSLSNDKETMFNLIGHGDPDTNGFLLIDLQFNVPIKSFGRRQGGAFVREIESGTVFLAHRGIVTRGKSRVPKSELFAATSMTPISVSSSAGPIELFLVTPLNSKNLFHDIATFAQEIRAAAGAIMEPTAEEAQARPFKIRPDFDTKLGEYFNEFCGSRSLPQRVSTIVVVRHGNVVTQLAEILSSFGKVYKSKLVDLALVSKNSAHLFEIKTSTDPTSIYTAIGQLSIHGIALANQFAGKQIHKVLVVPTTLSVLMRKKLENDLAIQIIEYKWHNPKTVIFNSSDMERIPKR